MAKDAAAFAQANQFSDVASLYDHYELCPSTHVQH
jgi:hypothetical protein